MNKLILSELLFQELKVKWYLNNIIKVSNTTLYEKLYKGTELIALPKGNNFENWTIRIRESKTI